MPIMHFLLVLCSDGPYVGDDHDEPGPVERLEGAVTEWLYGVEWCGTWRGERA